MYAEIVDVHNFNGILVPVRLTSFGLRRRAVKRTTYQRKVDMDMLNAVECVGRRFER